MKDYIYSTKKVPEVYTIICDVCNRRYSVGGDTFEIQEFTHITKDCGYNSVFGDGIKLEVDICQHCLKTILDRDLNLGLENYIIREDVK